MRVALLAAAMALCCNAAIVETLIGNGKPGFSDTEVNNPYGLVMGPDGALYFCDMGNNRVRRVDLTTRRVATIAGNGRKAYAGDGGPAIDASLAAPHELVFDSNGDLYFAERDNHVIRKVNMKTGIISTVAGTGAPGFSGDGGPGTQAQLRQPHCVFRDADTSLLICDIGNRRIRRLHLDTGIIETWAGTGEQKPTPDGVNVRDAPLNGPRTLARAANGDLYVALRETNAIYRIDHATNNIWRVAGTGDIGYSGDGGSALIARFGGTNPNARAVGPKGLALAGNSTLYVADTESHAVRVIDLKKDAITTILGTGEMGDGPEGDPKHYRLNRPHSVLFVNGVLYVGDSEAHRILVLRP